MEQQLVQSGYDVEVALGGRYLQYLLLLALDTGVIPVELSFGDPPYRARAHVPGEVDRTYELDPTAPQGEPMAGAAPFTVRVLPGHPAGADLRIDLVVHLTRESGGLDVTNLPVSLFVRLDLQVEHAPDGGLDSAGLRLELVDLGQAVVDVAATQGVTKDQLLASIGAAVNRTLDLGGVGSGSRLQDVALRTHEADGESPACLGIYLNLRLRGGPEPDNFLPARGDVALGRNILPADADLAFATRADLSGCYAEDAACRRAERSGSGHPYPLRTKPSDPTSSGVDDDGVLTWTSAGDFHAGLLADASLLDVAPNRLTIVRRRWDPFFGTHHQIGLRPGGTLVTADGIALWGKAVLTRTPDPVRNVVIRDTERDADGAPTGLRYRVDDVDPFRADLTRLAPGADREAFTQPDPVGDPYLFQVGVVDAAVRVPRQRIRGAHPYLVKGVEIEDNRIGKVLVVSEQEVGEERGRLIAEHTAAAAEQIVAQHDAEVRARVLAEFADLGVVPTQEQVDAELAGRLQALIDADVAGYVAGQLGADLDAALQPLLRLELAPTHFGRLQSLGLLTLTDFVPVHAVEDDQWSYRDRYGRSEETTTATRLADDLRGRPRYRSTPDGPVFT